MRADRLLSLMLLLQSRGKMTAQELAERLEVSERTIYRDVEALSFAGIPVYTQSGTNGGVQLDEHYRISLTGLSRPEIHALFIAGNSKPLADLGLGKATEEALRKLFAALPAAHRDEAEMMRQRIHLDAANWFVSDEPVPLLPILQQAVWEDRLVALAYLKANGERVNYTIAAYGLVAKSKIWYLIGQKRDGEMRTYRISRILDVTICEECFQRDATFDLAAYWRNSTRAFEQQVIDETPPYHAILDIHPRTLWYFDDYFENRYEHLTPRDGSEWLRIRVLFDNMGDALWRIMGFGSMIKVLEPEVLRSAVIETAQNILDAYQP